MTLIPLHKRFFKPGKDSRVLSILESVHACSRVSQSELGQQASLSGAMINKYIKDLQDKGLLTLTPVNGKSYSYGLTTHGEQTRQLLLGQFCAEIVQIYSALKEGIRAKLTALAEQGQTSLILFGASETCEVVLAALEGTHFRVVAISDNDPAKHGQSFHGHIVVPPQLIEKIPCQAVIITSFGRQEEIFRQISALAASKNLQIIRL